MLGRPDPVREWADRLFSIGPRRPGEADGASLTILYTTDSALLGRRLFLGSAARDITIGRGPDSTFVLAGDGMSRLHARLERRGEVWWLIDRGSTNGTHVDDERIQEAPLHDGDRVALGHTILEFIAARPRGR